MTLQMTDTPIDDKTKAAPVISREDAEIEGLEKLARAATPGPWVWHDPNPEGIWEHNGPDLIALETRAPIIESYGYDTDGLEIETKDAAFITAANPATILKMTALIRQLRAEKEAAERFKTMSMSEALLQFGEMNAGQRQLFKALQDWFDRAMLQAAQEG